MRRLQKETILLTNEGDSFWSVFTYNKGLQHRLQSFAKKYPENCRFKSRNNEGGETYEIDKGRLSIRLTAPYSEERRRELQKKARENERKSLLKNKRVDNGV